MSTIQTNLQSAYTSISNLPRVTVTYVSSKFPQITALAKSSFSYLSLGLSTLANKSFSWIKVKGIYAAQKAAPYVNSAKMQLLQHKGIVFAGVVISTALYALYYFWKNLPQQPIVKIQSTLNISKLSISVPKEMHGIPDVTLTFCIDKSFSMINEGHTNKFSRMQDVQNSMIKMLDDAQKRVDESKALIRISVVTFNSTSEVILEPTSLVTQKNTVRKIIDKINQIKTEGDTDLFSGLYTATTQVEKLLKSNPMSRHTLVLITDGEDKSVRGKIDEIHSRLNKANADFFAIGVGKGHSWDILQKITDRKLVKGTYINTTNGLDTIDSSITKIYMEALSTFNQIQLTCPQLKADTWSVSGYTSKEKDGYSSFELGSLSEGATCDLKIEVKGQTLSEPLDLSGVKFLLTFTDPKGKKGYQYIPWQANTVIEPAILKA